MSTDLHQRLADLAGDAPDPGVGGAAALWAAGKRLQRRRTAAGAGAIAACLLLVVSAVGALRPGSHTAFPVGEPDAAGALPSRLHVPGRWLESNADDPVGPLAALLTADQGWSGRTSYVGVSAATGEYRRLDLPDAAAAETGLSPEAVLSPSGRYVAYWAVMPESSESGKAGDATLGDPPVSGPAVYDTTTGDTLQERIESPQGLSPWDLRWIDGDRLYLQAGQIEAFDPEKGTLSSRAIGAGWIWSMTGQRRLATFDVPGMAKQADVMATDGRGHVLVRARGKGAGYLFVDPAHPEAARTVTMAIPGDGGTSSPYWASVDGRVAVATSTPDGAPSLALTTPDGPGRNLPQVLAWDVYGWSDPTHVVVAVAGQDNRAGESEIVSVDVGTGESQPFIDMPGTHLNPPQLASELLSAAPVDRGQPDWPTDPRVFVAAGLGALVLLGLALRIRGRRVRA